MGTPTTLAHSLGPIALLTAHARHGGVETLVELQRSGLGAQVIVTGGDRRPTCPFPYRWCPSGEALEHTLRSYSVVLFHWIPPWARDAVAHSGTRAVEFVHNLSTAGPAHPAALGTLTHSQFVADALQKVRGGPVWVAPHGIAASPRNNVHGPWIGGPTTLSEGKGLDLVVKAAGLLKREGIELPLRFYGEGEAAGSLGRLARRLGVRAEWLPALSSAAARMHEFRWITLPSREEGFPLVALEALAADCPVIASELPWTKELRQRAQAAGYPLPLEVFPPNDEGALAEILRRRWRRDFKREGRTLVERCFRPSAHLSALEQALRWVHLQPPPPKVPLSRTVPFAPTGFAYSLARKLGVKEDSAALELLWRERLRWIPRGSHRERTWRWLRARLEN